MSKVNKKKRNRKIRSLVLLLFLTIVMLSTATYAWFTSNRTVKVETIDVNISATSGLQISADGITWKSLLTKTDLLGASQTYSSAVNTIEAGMTPVSTGGTVANGKLQFYTGTVEGGSGGGMVLTTRSTNDTSGAYVVFDIFLKTEMASTVYLEKGSGVVPKTVQDDKGLQNAARYAFLKLGNTTSTDTTSNIQGLGSSSNSSSDVTIFEPNYDVHTQTGINNATTYYGFNGTTNPATPSQTGGSPINYYGIDGNVTNETLTTTNPPLGAIATNKYAQKWGTIVRTNAAYSTAANNYAYVTGNTGGTVQQNLYYPAFDQLEAGVTKVRVYMWVEGQDIDCENNASGTNLSYTISLTLDDPGRP
jgi:hypothetical protein